MQSLNIFLVDGKITSTITIYAYRRSWKTSSTKKYYAFFVISNSDYYEGKVIEKSYNIRCYGNLAKEVKENLNKHDNVIIYGTLERREGLTYVVAAMVAKTEKIYKYNTKPGRKREERPDNPQSKDDVFVEPDE